MNKKQIKQVYKSLYFRWINYRWFYLQSAGEDFFSYSRWIIKMATERKFRFTHLRFTNFVQSHKLYRSRSTVYPKKYAHGFCFAVLCCGYTLTDFPISIRLTSLALWQSKDCPSASKATLMNMDKYFMWIHYEWLHNHNKAKHNKTVCIFLGIYCKFKLCCVLLWFGTDILIILTLT